MIYPPSHSTKTLKLQMKSSNQINSGNTGLNFSLTGSVAVRQLKSQPLPGWVEKSGTGVHRVTI
jgi:hypothetical protein